MSKGWFCDPSRMFFDKFKILINWNDLFVYPMTHWLGWFSIADWRQLIFDVFLLLFMHRDPPYNQINLTKNPQGLRREAFDMIIYIKFRFQRYQNHRKANLFQVDLFFQLTTSTSGNHSSVINVHCTYHVPMEKPFISDQRWLHVSSTGRIPYNPALFSR